MAATIHHISFFVSDMDRVIHLFHNILGFELAWRIPEARGRILSKLLGIENMAAELAYLTSSENGVSVELARLMHPKLNPSNTSFGNIGSAGISIAVQELDYLYARLSEEGWNPLSRCLDLKTPDGDIVRAFCIRIENSLTIEFIEENKT